MFCTKCGNNLSDTAKFCNKCGTTIKLVVDEADKFDTNKTEKILNKRLSMKRPVIVGIVVVFAVIISLVLIIGNGKDASVVKKNDSNGKTEQEEVEVIESVTEDVISTETVEAEAAKNENEHEDKTEKTENIEKEVAKEEEPWDPEVITLVEGFVTFGSYEQDNNLANGKEPIKWRLLDSKDGNILLISEYVLDTRKYHTSDLSVTWETSEIRQWLNTEFLNEAFSTEEQEYISLSLIETEDNTEGTACTEGGNATEDKVFLLSGGEANFYLARGGKRIYPTARANRETGATSAWLRSPGERQNAAQIIDNNGSVYIKGAYVEFMPLGVRPVIWVTPNESILKQIEDEEIEIPQIKFVERDIQIGDYVKIGRFEQNNISADGVEPIEWQILDIKDDKALLLSKYILDARQFSDSEYTDRWTESDLRMWLTNEFYNSVFREEEKAYIVLTKLKEELRYISNDFEDNIFLLTSEQVETYFDGTYDGLADSTAEKTAYVDAHTKELAEKIGATHYTLSWWKRSMHSAGSFDGIDVYHAAGGKNQTDISGVRPAIWVKLSALDTGVLTKGENSKNTKTIKSVITFGADGYVTFGSFEQDNDVSNGPEPIEWMILEESENEMLLMSRFGLVTKNYHEDYSVLESNASVFKPEDYITWETSTIREWLNDDFYNSAFSEKEKEVLCINEIATSQYDITIDDRKEVMVEDYVYLLDSSEASKYEVMKIRIKPTEYALSQGIDKLGPNGDAPRLVRQEIGISETRERQQIITYDGKNGSFYLGEKLSHPVVCPVIRVKIN